MRVKVREANVTAEIARVVTEEGRFEENLALAKDFIDDIETLVKSMGNLYEEHAAQLISVGVTVEVNVTMMRKPALHACLGLSPSERGLVQADGKEAEEARDTL